MPVAIQCRGKQIHVSSFFQFPLFSEFCHRSWEVTYRKIGLIHGTILAVQSLSDSTKYKYRYLTLRRLGINDKSLFKTIRKQLLILFCVPAISAILCSFVMMSSLNNVYQQILGDKHLYLMYFGLNLIIFFLIYSIYWIATYIGFKRNINEES